MDQGYDLQELGRTVESLYAVRISRAFGLQGTIALRKVLQCVQSIFSQRDAENFRHELIVFTAIADVGSLRPERTMHYRTIDPVLTSLTGNSAIELLADGTYHVWHKPSVDILALSSKALVYQFKDRRDIFLVNGVECDVPRFFTAQASSLAAPRFRRLADAIEDYKANWIRTSRCYIFSTAWEDDERLVFRAHPEAIMRRSLEQFLQSRLGGDVEVLPEHIIDESRPVDLRVLWNLARQEVLIEIKWLGRSINGKSRTSFPASRANQGAKQLAGYLDRNRKRSGHRETRGVLVVFDARRRFPKGKKVSRADGFYYEHSEISYMPDFSSIRSDFERPYRLFAEPLL